MASTHVLKIGQRVSVFWPDDGVEYGGTVYSYASTRNGERIKIRYEDGEQLPLGEGEILRVHHHAKEDEIHSPPRTVTASRKRAAASTDATIDEPEQPKRTKQSKPLMPHNVEAHLKIRVKSERTVELFYRYLYRRMCVRLQMDREKARTPLVTVLRDDVRLEVPHDPVLAMTTTGNAYRHLDTGTISLGSDVRAALATVGLTPGSPEFFAGALMACLVDMSGINAVVLRGGLALTRWERSEESERVLEYPCTLDELSELEAFIAKYEIVQKAAGFTGTKLYSDAGFQTQGFRWKGYFAEWMRSTSQSPSQSELGQKASCLFLEVAARVRSSTTWQEANVTVQTLPGVGDYTGAQALLQVLFGVYEGDAAACFTDHFQVASMRDWCAYGPGPSTSCSKLFGTTASETLAGIRWLQEHQQERFAQYGVSFPYLRQPDGSPQLMAACDLEHSLCYFSRYLGVREHLGAHAEVLSLEMPPGFRLFRMSKLQGIKSAAKVRALFDEHRSSSSDGGLKSLKSRHY